MHFLEREKKDEKAEKKICDREKKLKKSVQNEKKHGSYF